MPCAGGCGHQFHRSPEQFFSMLVRCLCLSELTRSRHSLLTWRIWRASWNRRVQLVATLLALHVVRRPVPLFLCLYTARRRSRRRTMLKLSTHCSTARLSRWVASVRSSANYRRLSSALACRWWSNHSTQLRGPRAALHRHQRSASSRPRAAPKRTASLRLDGSSLARCPPRVRGIAVTPRKT